MHRIAVELNKTGQGRVGGLQGHDMKTRIVQTIVSAAVLVGLSLAHPAFCAPQQQGQQHNSDSVSYEQFLGRDSPDTESTSTATATVPTWTAEPGQEGGIQPVSYTHLDVYKRQFCCADSVNVCVSEVP